MRADQIDPQHYQQLLAEKVAATKALFAEFELPEITVFESVAQGYRLRCEFRVWHEGDDFNFIMFDPQSKQRINIEQFIPAAALINQLMPALKEKITGNELLKRKLYQVDFLTTLSGQVAISLIYHKPLTDEWQLQANQLKSDLARFASELNIIGRSRKQKVLLDKDFVTETLSVFAKQYHYQQIENSFTQPNGLMNQKMLEWAMNFADGIGGDFVELYCGNGNFTIPLSEKFDRVLATEISKSSVNSANYNLELNNIKNVNIARMSSEEFSDAVNNNTEFKRLKHIDISSYNFSTVLVDPPRAGLDSGTLDLVKQYDNIIYISCNPVTLAENLATICQTHRIEKFAFFDQFPYTHHIETGVFLQKLN